MTRSSSSRRSTPKWPPAWHGCKAVHAAIGEIFLPLTGSTLTPVVVFIPLAFLDGVPGVFFRALAITMTVSLLMSLVLAISLTPSLAASIIRVKPEARHVDHEIEAGRLHSARVFLRFTNRPFASPCNTASSPSACCMLLCSPASISTRGSSRTSCPRWKSAASSSITGQSAGHQPGRKQPRAAGN